MAGVAGSRLAAAVACVEALVTLVGSFIPLAGGGLAAFASAAGVGLALPEDDSSNILIKKALMYNDTAVDNIKYY